MFSLHQNTFDNVNVLVMSQFLWGEFFKHLLYEQEKKYNNKIKITFGSPSLTQQTSTQDPTSDKSRGGVGGGVKGTNHFVALAYFTLYQDEQVVKLMRMKHNQVLTYNLTMSS